MAPYDFDFRTRVLNAFWALQKPFEQMTPEDFARFETAQSGGLATRLVAGPRIPLGEVRDERVPTRGGQVRVRVYAPMAGPLPVILYFHGGGFVLGGIESFDHVVRSIARATKARVVSVDYRLAPAHPFPAAVEDAEDVLRWALEHRGRLGLDGESLFVAGDSAGGNLAAVLALHARDAGIVLAGQILIYPATDMTRSYPSLERHAHAPVLSAAAVEHFASHYLGAQRRDDPRCSPIVADPTGVAPALVLTAEYDPLVDQGRAYAEHLRASGVPVHYRDFARAVHGYLSFPKLSRAAAPTLDEIARFVAQQSAPSSR